MARAAAAGIVDLTGQVLITRPAAAAQVWRIALALRGIGSMIEPLLHYQAVPSRLPVMDYQAVLFTSAAGVQHLPYAALPADWPDWPCYCVGQATARAARQQGWRQAMAHGANAMDLAAWVIQSTTPARGALLWPCGVHRQPEPQASLGQQGFTLQPWVVYEALASTALSQNGQSALRQRRLRAVLLTSERSARLFADLLRQAGLLESCRTMTALCLSPAVAAAAAELPWAEVLCAPTPQEDALLSVLQNQLRRWTISPIADDALLHEA